MTAKRIEVCASEFFNLKVEDLGDGTVYDQPYPVFCLSIHTNEIPAL